VRSLDGIESPAAPLLKTPGISSTIAIRESLQDGPIRTGRIVIREGADVESIPGD